MTIDLSDVKALIVGVAAFLVAWGILWRGLLKPVWVRVKKIHDLIEHELKPNGGSSMKDTTTRAANAVDEAVAAAKQAEVAANGIAEQMREIRSAQETTFTVFDVWIEKNQREHDEIWAAMAHLGYDRRVPPADPGNGAT